MRRSNSQRGTIGGTRGQPLRWMGAMAALCMIGAAAPVALVLRHANLVAPRAQVAQQTVGHNEVPVARPPMVACFAPGTPLEVVAAVEALERGPGINFVAATRWSGSFGSPYALTWSLVPDGLSISNGGVPGETVSPSELFNRMDSLFASQGGRATWIAQIQACFDRWALLSGTSYTRVTDGTHEWDDGAAWGSAKSSTRGDIRVSMKPLDGVNGVLAYTYYPSNGDMVFDRYENWASSADTFRFFRNTFIHEHGHGIGLGHSCPIDQTKLMEPYLSTVFDGPQHDDIRGSNQLYGDDYESNNTAGTAPNIGTLAFGSPINIGAVPPQGSTASKPVSIDRATDVDYFQVSLTGSVYATITVTPVGSNYLAGPQNGDGSCSSGTNDNSLAASKLSVSAIASNGTTVLATATASAAGNSATLNVTLNGPGTCYVKVNPADSPIEPQMYTLSLSAVSTSDCNTNGTLDSSELAGNDCNTNNTLDVCELAGGAGDCNTDHTLDACQLAGNDCNTNGSLDLCDTIGGFKDCNTDRTPDPCQLSGRDCNSNNTLDLCDTIGAVGDCNTDRTPDLCQIAGHDCNTNGTLDPCDVRVGGSETDSPGTVNLPIPDNSPTGGSSSVGASIGGNVTDVNVGVLIQHTRQGDIIAALSHAGTTVTVINRPGFPQSGTGFTNQNFGISATNVLFMLDDAATFTYDLPTVSGINNITGTWKPDPGPLSTFNGLAAGGTWTLTVSDNNSGETGTLKTWSLFLTTVTMGVDCDTNGTPDACEPDCNSNGTPDICELNAGTDANANGTLDVCEACATCPGDVNGDGKVDGADVTAFVTCYITYGPAVTPACRCADVFPVGSPNGLLDSNDVTQFVNNLLTRASPPCP